ncbi:MAG TPA: hypothetical protein VH575_29295, partial [Gemmataceae bacterium]
EAGGANNPHGCKGKPEDEEINRDNVTVDSPRDYSHEASTGNSVSYAVRRLSRQRPAGSPRTWNLTYRQRRL